MSRPTPHEWFARFQQFGPDETREAIGLIVGSVKMQALFKAYAGQTGLRAETREGSRGPIKMLSKRASRCTVCKQGITVGEPICYQREVGAWHQRCDRGQRG